MKLAACAAALLLACIAGGTARGAGVPFCTGAQLTPTFRVVPGSAGAGNIVYALTVKNRSTRTCAITGLPNVQLYGKSGKRLPTHVRAAFPGALTAVLVRLAPGRAARAKARFSPDVPGPGEPVSGRMCEPVSHWLTVTAKGARSARARVSPPTPVCEHGSLQFTAYARV
jgi:Domain of unknown function (DUF4232)